MKNILKFLLFVLVVALFNFNAANAFPKEFKPHQYTVVKASHILVPTENKAK